MVENTMKLINEIEELKKDFIAKVGSDMIEGMDETHFMMVKKVFNILELSEEIMKEQAVILVGMNEKLDKILLKVGES